MTDGEGKRRLVVLQDELVGSLNADGSRNFVQPADVDGRYTRRRWVAFSVLLAVYLSLPFVQIGGAPAVYLDIVHRRFHLFGATFNAQDTWLLFLFLSGVLLLLVVVTARWGRIWCGYACPQTVFLEGLYRRVQRWVEGPRGARIRRDAGPWTWARLWRKTVVHGVFLGLSFVIAHVFLSYFVSLPSLWSMMGSSPAKHPVAFAWSSTMTLVLYANFAWFREQLCLIVCPYGRLQSALTDEDTLVVGYDVGRGEPRGKKSDPERGDCVACHRCVVVCPTGIDIRHGLQMECIGCAACIDACDEVMQRVGQAPGLIRYDSMRQLSGGDTAASRGRGWLYGIAAVAWLVGLGFAVQTREPFEATLLRPPGGTPFVVRDGWVQNTLQSHIVNKNDQAEVFRLENHSDERVEVIFPGSRVELGPGQGRHVPFLVRVPEASFEPDIEAVVRVTAERSGVSVEVAAPIVGPTRRDRR